MPYKSTSIEVDRKAFADYLADAVLTLLPRLTADLHNQYPLRWEGCQRVLEQSIQEVASRR